MNQPSEYALSNLSAIGLQFRIAFSWPMIKSEYEQSLDFLLKVYNVFLCQALNLMQKPSLLSPPMQKALSLWVHPKGISNLVKTISLNYQTELPYPEVKSMQQDQDITKMRLSPKNLIEDQPEEKLQRPRPPKKTAVKLEQADSILQEPILEQEGEESAGQYPEKMGEHDESSYNQSGSRLYKRGPYKSYTMDEKMKAVHLFMEQQLSITEISRTLGIPCKNIKRWATEGIFRKRGGGRKRTNPGLQEEVYRWLNMHHPFGDNLHIEEIQEYALSRSRDPAFKASRGWAIKFIERFSLRHRYVIL